MQRPKHLARRSREPDGVRALAPAALVGMLIGLGLGLGTNVSGLVLGFYGLAAGALLAAAVYGVRRRR